MPRRSSPAEEGWRLATIGKARRWGLQSTETCQTEAQRLAGRAGWYGKELDQSGAWIRTLDDTHRAEIDAALAQVKRARLPLFGFGRDDFPLASTAALLAEISDELENGLGAVRLRGLPVERYSDDDIRRIFWGLGRHLGTALYQNARGEIMGEVRDETRLSDQTYAPIEPGKVVSSRARARSTGPLRWHTDRCDVIALLCVRNAKAGGISKLTSIVTIYNEILRRRPDLLALLCQDYWRARPADEDGAAPTAAFALPVFGVRGRQADLPVFPHLCRAGAGVRRRASHHRGAERGAGSAGRGGGGGMPLLAVRPRRHPVAEQPRHLPRPDRLRGRQRQPAGAAAVAPLAVDAEQPPPARGFENFWGSVEPGAVRGGVTQPATGARIPLRRRRRHLSERQTDRASLHFGRQAPSSRGDWGPNPGGSGVAGFEPWTRERGAEIIASESAREGARLPILHALQAAFGYIHAEAVPMIADALNLTRAEVHGVVSFYHDFRRTPPGRHVLRLCRAEACQSLGADALAGHVRERLGVDWHDTTADGAVTLLPVFCLGLCAIGPSAMLDGAPLGRLDSARIDAALERTR